MENINNEFQTFLGGSCSAPSLFIMSNNRRACITYQHDFFKVLSILIQPPADNTLPKHKVLHANRCFDLWKKKESKKIFSHRLDIKYQMDYKANGFKYTLSNTCSRMYY